MLFVKKERILNLFNLKLVDTMRTLLYFVLAFKNQIIFILN
ncbi:protein of unknown function [Tenacibaculum aestuariivivum]